jgi:hypothetical protein
MRLCIWQMLTASSLGGAGDPALSLPLNAGDISVQYLIDFFFRVGFSRVFFQDSLDVVNSGLLNYDDFFFRWHCLRPPFIWYVLIVTWVYTNVNRKSHFMGTGETILRCVYSMVQQFSAISLKIDGGPSMERGCGEAVPNQVSQLKNDSLQSIAIK